MKLETRSWQRSGRRRAGASVPLVLALAVGLALAACRSAVPSPATDVATAGAGRPHLEKLDALLWFQSAEENRQIQRATFRAAERALEAAVADPGWSALGQGPEARDLPPAVIADVDETLLDNSPFEAWMLRAGRTFNPDDWTAWVDAAEARAIPGAVEFARAAAERGVRVFYVTNRDAHHEESTRRNLSALGFPLGTDFDDVLLRGERPDWTSDKETRRQLVAATHRVVLLIGDDLNDFLSGVRDATAERRADLAAAHGERFGTSWFVLPNPIYGSWERALSAGSPPPATPDAALELRLARLRAFR